MSAEHHFEGPLEEGGQPPVLAPGQEPPSTARGRSTEWVAEHDCQTRDMRPAVGTRGEPGPWTRARLDASVALARRQFGDARWSFLYKASDTAYAATEPAGGQVAAANRRMRGAPVAEAHGPFLKPPVWTWEVPLYFWVGGVASGASFMGLACDVAGDRRSAALARKVALGAVMPAPLLLIADLGRPERFLNMLRIFKPRSPMNMGAWCLIAFSATGAAAVGGDLVRRPRAARALGAVTSVLGGYLGSYTGVLLACTAVPLWARSRTILGPVFVATATATGAAATRLALVARGLPDEHPTGNALATIETASLLIELSLSELGQQRLGDAAACLRAGRPGLLYRTAKTLVVGGLAIRRARRRFGPRAEDVASVMYLAGGLAFRYAWVMAGRASAQDDGAVAAMGRGGHGLSDSDAGAPERREPSVHRRPLPLPVALHRAYGEAVRRTSLAVERLVRRRARG